MEANSNGEQSYREITLAADTACITLSLTGQNGRTISDIEQLLHAGIPVPA